MQLMSPDFADQGAIPERFTCEGENISPGLEWRDVPDGTGELALTCEDPDAPGKTFVHWVMWGIDPRSDRLDQGEIPDGARHGRNDFGDNAYGGPCPPPGHGRHHYHFTLYAVSESVALAPGASINELRDALAAKKTLAEASLVGTYERQG
jgi:Raf kinase inhibitor-like YbhB/YbcL family protein